MIRVDRECWTGRSLLGDRIIMGKVFRGLLAVLLGIVTFGVVVMVGEMVGHMIFPPPPGLDPHNPESFAAAMKLLPIGALISVMVAWGLATFAGAWVAARVAPGGRLAFGIGIGVLALRAGVATMMMIQHPLWMWIVGVVEFLPAAYLGSRLATYRAGRPLVGV
jgi:hypothetical protein